MNRSIIVIAVIVLVVVVVAGGYVGVTQLGLNNPQATSTPTPTASPSPTPEPSLREQIRNQVMVYIQTNHADAATVLPVTSWTGGSITPEGLVGYETYQYIGDGWNVTIGNVVYYGIIYNVEAVYTVNGGVKIDWQGTVHNGEINQTSYTATLMSTPELARTEVMDYIQCNHAETGAFVPVNSWTGGIVNQGMLVGSTLYSYVGGNWNVTMQYPVVPDPIYTVTADYNSSGISITWKGTWQNSTITETSYTDNLLTTQAEIRDAALAYIVANHTEAAHLLVNFTWTGGQVDTGLLGSVLYQYNSTGWKVEIRNPVVLNPTYTITANYVSGGTTIAWAGTLENNAVNETSYAAVNLTGEDSVQEQVRESIMAYLKAYRSESAQFMENLFWFGGQTTPGGIVGTETYLYESKSGMFIYEWTLEMKYPVVLNPIYTVSANYTGIMTNIVAWQGTWQAGVITETIYSYTP